MEIWATLIFYETFLRSSSTSLPKSYINSNITSKDWIMGIYISSRFISWVSKYIFRITLVQFIELTWVSCQLAVCTTEICRDHRVDPPENCSRPHPFIHKWLTRVWLHGEWSFISRDIPSLRHWPFPCFLRVPRNIILELRGWWPLSVG